MERKEKKKKHEKQRNSCRNFLVNIVCLFNQMEKRKREKKSKPKLTNIHQSITITITIIQIEKERENKTVKILTSCCCFFCGYALYIYV